MYILIIYFYINLFPISKLFIPDIYSSDKNKLNLKNVIPNEKISHFSGLDYPTPYPF